jgi:hypothetical protein
VSTTDEILRSIAVGAVGVTFEAADVYPDPRRRKHAEDVLHEYLVGALKRRGLAIVSGVRA